jgi:hypothetical protein
MSDDEIASMDAGLRHMFSVGYFDISTGQMIARYTPPRTDGVPAVTTRCACGTIYVWLLPPEEGK